VNSQGKDVGCDNIDIVEEGLLTTSDDDASQDRSACNVAVTYDYQICNESKPHCVLTKMIRRRAASKKKNQIIQFNSMDWRSSGIGPM